jgi:NitT/TauT family transport system substrate-binding protein
MSRRRHTLLAALAGLLLPFTGPARAADPLIVQAASAVPSIVYLPIYVADRGGFFKQEGVTLDLRYTNGGSLATQLVVSGDADVAHIVWQPAIQAYARGAKGKFFYQTYTRNSFFTAVLASSAIKTPADLAGKRIGVFNMASPGVFMAKSTARAAGVAPDSLSFFPVGLGAQALAAITTDRVDALELWDAEYANYAAIGQDLRYIFHPTLGDVGSGGFYASDTAIAQKKQALAGFSRALAEGTAYLLANPESALRMYWSVAPGAKPPGSDQDALRAGLIDLKFVAQSFDIASRADKRFGEINTASVQKFIDAMHQEGEISETIPAAAIIDTQFIAYANQFDLAAARAPRDQ